MGEGQRYLLGGSRKDDG